MNVGFATRDITPAPGLTLSGFAARRNQPSEGIDDPLSVFALAIDDRLLLVFDLLGLGPELLEEIQAELDAQLPEVPRENRILCCTHTHSAPATITLLGCGITNYGAGDIRTIQGAHSKEIAALLGYDYGSEVVHRNNLVVL